MYILGMMCTWPVKYLWRSEGNFRELIICSLIVALFKDTILETSKIAYSFQIVNWKQSNVRIPPKFLWWINKITEGYLPKYG